MPHLYPNLRVTQVFGANTDVGKTLLTTALLRANALNYHNGSAGAAEANGMASSSRKQGPQSSAIGKGKKRVFYLKPVSTGPEEESDVAYVLRNTQNRAAHLISAHNLYQYREPMSPHLAARLAPDLPFPENNDRLIRSISNHVQECLFSLDGERGALYVETAGGVHSPALHPPHTQSTFLQSLRLPSVLMAAPQLGGIGTTISAYESLLIRGYDIGAVLCLENEYYRNHEFLSEYFRDRGISFHSIPAPPEKHGTVAEDGQRLEQWYTSLERSQEDSIMKAVTGLEARHDARIPELESMVQRTRDKAWWPFTQHHNITPHKVMVVDSAHGDTFDAYWPPHPEQTQKQGESRLNAYYDGSASWFTQSHGHANTELTLAAASAAGRYGHVLYPSAANKPALHLTEKLLETAGKGWASRVFFSDNGSTGIEVALKMALRSAGREYNRGGPDGTEVGVLGIRGGYHGDTIGAMDAAEQGTFNEAVDWYKGRGHWFSPPVVSFVDGRPTISTTGPDRWHKPPAGLNAVMLPENRSEAELRRHQGSDAIGVAEVAGWTATFPSVQDIYDVPARLSTELADYYRQHIRGALRSLALQKREFGACIIEPVCLGAGGMVFVDPLFQACLIEVVRCSRDLFQAAVPFDEQSARPESDERFQAELERLPQRDPDQWQGLPIIYDEVFSGLHRFGYHTAASVLHYQPDISVYAKILTGGLVPLAATLASKSIFDTFLSPHKSDALLHGHSYTAHPIGCSVALKAIQMIEDRERTHGWKEEKRDWGCTLAGSPDEQGRGRWSHWSMKFVEQLSREPRVKNVMAMGTVLALEIGDEGYGYGSSIGDDFLQDLRRIVITSQSGEFEDFYIHGRPLGNVVYLMCTLFTKSATLRAMESLLLDRAKQMPPLDTQPV